MDKIIPSFSDLNEAALMFLENAFDEIEKALENDCIQDLVYSKKIEYSKDDLELDKDYQDS